MIIKICGIRSIEDACMAADCGADWIGLNFWARSPRCVGLNEAKSIAQAVAGRVKVVGLFVNARRLEIDQTIEQVGLDLVQLHGDEPPELVKNYGERAIKAVRLRGAAVIGRYAPALLLLDSDVGNYGGSGVALDWLMAHDLATTHRLILAGGLTPENVAQAIRTVQPIGVDVASGVERTPGVKDRARVQAFVQAVRGVT